MCPHAFCHGIEVLSGRHLTNNRSASVKWETTVENKEALRAGGITTTSALLARAIHVLSGCKLEIGIQNQTRIFGDMDTLLYEGYIHLYYYFCLARACYSCS